MQRIRVHEAISVSGRADSVHEALERNVPPLSKLLEFITYLHSLQACLVMVLSGNIRDNPYFYQPHADSSIGAPLDCEGVCKLRAIRQQLVDLMLENAESMTNTAMAQSSSGWTMLMLTWIVVGQLTLCIERVRVRPMSRLNELTLERNELLTSSGGTRDVPHMSMCELRTALNVLRDRLNMLDDVDGTVVRYTLLLEHRAAQFACRSVANLADYDCGVWARRDGSITQGYIATMAWWFVWIKRYITWYLRLSTPSYFSNSIGHGRICHLFTPTNAAGRPGKLAAPVGRAAIVAFVEMFAATLNTRDHEGEFVNVAKMYNVAPGDLDEHTYVHGMGGVERATVQDVVGRRRTPEATSYIGLSKFRRPLVQWVRSFVRRTQLVGRGRFVGGGASCEAFIEQLAILHIVNAVFVAKLQFNWISLFVITHRGADVRYEQRVQQALANGMPFIVQRCGRFACVVPAPPSEYAHSILTTSMHAVVEAHLGIDEGELGSGNDDNEYVAVMYDCADVFDAVTVWARFMLECWGGNIKHANKRLAPLLRAMFAAGEVPPHPPVALLVESGSGQSARADRLASASNSAVGDEDENDNDGYFGAKNIFRVPV